MKSRRGSGGAPCSWHHASNAVQVSSWVRSNSSRKAAHCERSSAAYPENTGAMSSPRTSSGLQDTIRTNAPSEVISAGNETTLSSTITSGRCRAMISRSCGSQYVAPSISAWYVGCTNVASWSRVGLANSGAVSLMKSIQNCPAASVASGPRPGRAGRGRRGPRRSRTARACRPTSARPRTPPRCPWSSSTLPRPMHWLVGPYADSGMNSTVRASVTRAGYRPSRRRSSLSSHGRGVPWSRQGRPTSGSVGLARL